MSFLLAGMLDRHDRSGFEIFGYCSSPEDGSAIRARVIAALDHHVLIGAMTDLAAATRIRADEIDRLIDLDGLTKGARVGVLRCNPRSGLWFMTPASSAVMHPAMAQAKPSATSVSGPQSKARVVSNIGRKAASSRVWNDARSGTS